MTESDKQTHPEFTLKCPDCGHNHLVQIRASDVVTIYKCPNCGELVAPVNTRGEALNSGSADVPEIKRRGED